ncbi:MAG TPA: hypothetical protein VE441_12950 [Mycobacterium sp.]|nr:hypothetical protein [Mycobacterium sp.]
MSLLLWAAVLAVTAVACGSAPVHGAAKATATATPSAIGVPPAVPPPPPCAAWGCRPGGIINLAPGWNVRLWLSGDQRNLRSRPVVELLHGQEVAQWWISPLGDGWNASLTCLTHGPEPNCALLDSLGMHAAVAEMLTLRGGKLVHAVHAEAITNSVGMRAADLDGDDYLDVLGISNDYRPNFAQGHDYWQTFRYHDSRLTMTGCARQAETAPAPTRLLTGPCPTL